MRLLTLLPILLLSAACAKPSDSGTLSASIPTGLYELESLDCPDGQGSLSIIYPIDQSFAGGLSIHEESWSWNEHDGTCQLHVDGSMAFDGTVLSATQSLNQGLTSCPGGTVNEGFVGHAQTLQLPLQASISVRAISRGTELWIGDNACFKHFHRYSDVN